MNYSVLNTQNIHRDGMDPIRTARFNMQNNEYVSMRENYMAWNSIIYFQTRILADRLNQ
jgi:hypothetical protein